MKIYGITVVNSEGYINGKESDTILGADKSKVLEEAYQWYENLNSADEDIIDTDFLYQDEFEEELETKALTYIQYPDHHIQFEYFETEI